MVREDYPLLVKQFKASIKKKRIALKQGASSDQDLGMIQKSPSKGCVETHVELAGRCDANYTNMMSFKEEGDT